MRTLVAGRYYRNFRGDELGPMEERLPDHWLDQYGVVYAGNGIQWGHVEGSTGNIDLSTSAFRETSERQPLGGERA